jgi:hypothetical protein
MGGIFGGFTPVEWESGDEWKVDYSQKSFLFTMKNPHNIPARRCGLKAERKGEAIDCNSEQGDIMVLLHQRHLTGREYRFHGFEEKFQVKQIEITN